MNFALRDQAAPAERKRGNGMTLLPALAVADLATAAQRRLLIPFAAPVPSRAVALVRRRTQVRKYLVDAVVEITQAVASAALSSNRRT